MKEIIENVLESYGKTATAKTYPLIWNSWKDRLLEINLKTRIFTESPFYYLNGPVGTGKSYISKFLCMCRIIQIFESENKLSVPLYAPHTIAIDNEQFYTIGNCMNLFFNTPFLDILEKRGIFYKNHGKIGAYFESPKSPDCFINVLYNPSNEDLLGTNLAFYSAEITSNTETEAFCLKLSNIATRLRSRGFDNFGVIVQSPKSEDNIVYRTIKDRSKSISLARWQLRPEEYSGETFKVYIYPKKDPVCSFDDRCESPLMPWVLDVPIEYKKDFILDTKTALREIAGVVV